MESNQKKKVIRELENEYEKNFSFIETVINSCKTQKQVQNSYAWALDYIRRNCDYETTKRPKSEAWFVVNYFRGKNSIVFNHTAAKTKYFLDNLF